ncbi:hypothetical protein QBC47DRAFT_364239 [Echria macrotheca]|uniref:Uncharacterized protein n=1 Tax=Echria macrotheca TaxID=438768 RepID=A0AAJ0B566_9PEZI|nr:hypothetical protein QBC47DRAFT_364239 [Echria macrotheca]
MSKGHLAVGDVAVGRGELARLTSRGTNHHWSNSVTPVTAAGRMGPHWGVCLIPPDDRVGEQREAWARGGSADPESFEGQVSPASPDSKKPGACGRSMLQCHGRARILSRKPMMERVVRDVRNAFVPKSAAISANRGASGDGRILCETRLAGKQQSEEFCRDSRKPVAVMRGAVLPRAVQKRRLFDRAAEKIHDRSGGTPLSRAFPAAGPKRKFEIGEQDSGT